MVGPCRRVLLAISGVDGCHPVTFLLANMPVER